MIHLPTTGVHVDFTPATETARYVKPLALIEADRSLCGELRAVFESAGFQVEVFHRGIDGLADLRRRSYSLAVIGLDLVDSDPFVICREASPLLPVVTVTSGSDTDTCVRALESGADDCIVRPVPGREFIARIRNILQRSGTNYERRSLELSLSEMRVRNGSATCDLTRGEAELLALLLRRAPTPVRTAEIASLLAAPRATVESRIKSLRRKLGSGRIVNRGGFGYAIDDT